jgi:murein DD-endopeptidase MepM/ murein hydrolase activator NlpD
MVRSDGRLYAGDPARNESYPQFGADLLAVSDATVVEVVDGLPEEVPGALPSGMTIDRADGNHVILDLGDGLYAAYAHLQPGSVRVRVGERVERGQVLGWLGNSGNSELPHLHFHVMDRPAPLAADGRPYVIDSFELVGRAVSADDLETEARQPKPIVIDAVPGASRRLRQLPSNLDVVVFE